MGYHTQGEYVKLRHSWYRQDTYHSTEYPCLDGTKEKVRCVDESDTSPVYTGYDPVCMLCWLNICHTLKLHDVRCGCL